MKLLKLARASNLTERTSKLVKNSQDAINKMRQDLGAKEYVVFVNPLAKRLRSGVKRIFTPTPEVGTADDLLAGSTPELVSQEAADSMLVKEVFVRAVPPMDEPENQAETSDDLSQEIAPEPVPEDEPESMPPAIEHSTGATESNEQEVKSPRAAAKGPYVRTMVEALPDATGVENGIDDLLSEDLQEIFKTVTYTNPRTKALLKNREPLDVYELAKELKDYARSIGASS